MAVIAHTVAAADVDLVRQALLVIYSVKAEALHGDTLRYLEQRTRLSDIGRHRREMTSLEGLLDQLGWELVHETADVTVTAARELLVEAYRAALADATEHFSAGAGTRGWPLDDMPRVGRALSLSRTLLSRLEGLAEADGDAASSSSCPSDAADRRCES